LRALGCQIDYDRAMALVALHCQPET
jgi:hypothetical protein